VDWKAVDILLRALAVARRNAAVELEVIGDGPERGRLEALARELGVEKFVRFMGFLPQTEAAERLSAAQGLMLSSLYECGGAVVLEAMACGLPVAATAWGGPMDYLDVSCGILVQPNSYEQMVVGFAGAMVRLAGDAELRKRMGEAGRRKVVAEYDWEKKVDRMMEIYEAARGEGRH